MSLCQYTLFVSATSKGLEQGEGQRFDRYSEVTTTILFMFSAFTIYRSARQIGGVL